MKFTLSWLKDFLDTDASLDEISATLTNIGLEVENVTDPREALKDFIVARIVEATQHPDADKLRVCKVFDGTEEKQIVCGASNARAGINIVLAREGVVIPHGGMVIKKTKIRGVESNGMICSAEELGLEKSSEGIMELPESAKPGSPAAPAIGADDPVIEIAITPNRGDCLGVYGIARDLAAAGLGQLKPLNVPALKTNGRSPIGVTIETDSCSHFTGCTIKGVKNFESPDWLKRRLTAIGSRPISALVDITNYVMLTYNRPLHVYDVAKLSGGIIVRRAKDGEKLKALDGKEYTLTEKTVVIADEKKALGLGGVMGGEETGCTNTTTQVFLESALFDPIVTATTGRKLEILSDARYRFERGVDPAFVDNGAKLAVAMILELCGGEASELVSVGEPMPALSAVAFDPKLIERLGGVMVSHAETVDLLTALGCGVTESGSILDVIAPSWRPDIAIGADLVEEILRLKGYAAILATTLPPVSGFSAAITPEQKRLWTARRLLAARGMLETCNWSFASEADAKHFGGANESLALLNPISSDLAIMRPSLLPHLLIAARNNANRGIANIGLFETGLQFTGLAPDGQQPMITGVRAGQIFENSYKPDGFAHAARDVDAWDAKADATTVLAALGVNTEQLKLTAEAPAWYHPGRSVALTLGGKIILAYAGELHPAIINAYDLKGRVSAFEIFANAIPTSRAKGKARKAYQRSDFQAVERDFAFTVDRGVSAEALIRAVMAADKKLLQSVEIFDVYMGKGIDPDKKSVALKAMLQADDRTLSDAEIVAASNAIIASVVKSTGGVLRS